jgi:hypothetical protein
MASLKNTDLEALSILIEAKKNQHRSEIEIVEKAIAILRKWIAEQPQPEAAQPKPKIIGGSVREIVLEAVGAQTTFRLKALIDRLIVTGKMSGPRTAIYGTVTGMLRRNDHIFKKMRRGQYRVIRPLAAEVEKHETENHQNGSESGASLH